MANQNPYPWDSVRMSRGSTPAPTSPTMADMNPAELRACQWAQADVEMWGRVVIIVPVLIGARAALLDRSGDVIYEDHCNIIPRLDLPRLEWSRRPAPRNGKEQK